MDEETKEKTGEGTDVVADVCVLLTFVRGEFWECFAQIVAKGNIS